MAQFGAFCTIYAYIYIHTHTHTDSVHLLDPNGQPLLLKPKSLEPESQAPYPALSVNA